jgi:hypothetical protein
MFGLDPLMLPAAYIAIAMTTADCPAQGPVEADVQFVAKDPPHINTQTAAQLTQQFGHDPDSTLATDGKWMVSGVTVVSRDGLQEQIGLQFKATAEVKTGTTCFTVAKVTNIITYSPTIYIASDYQNMACRYSATLMHEKRHVDTDIRTITDFIPDMKTAVAAYAQSLGPQGPYAAADLEKEKQRVVQQVANGLKPTWDQLLALRRKRQAEIDTVPNYMRDTALCPGQFPKFDGSQ